MVHPSHLTESRQAFRVVMLLAVILCAVLLYPKLIYSPALANYLSLHISLEVVAVCVSVLIFAIGWNTQKFLQSPRIIWLSAWFLGVALLDLSHLLSFAGMPDFVTPASADKGINFWLAGRTFAAIALLGALFMMRIPVFKNRSLKYLISLLVLLLVAALHLLFLFYPDYVPATFNEKTGLTYFKISFEYSLMFCYLLIALLNLSSMGTQRRVHTAGLFAASCIMAMSEFFFTLYATMSDSYQLLGHLYKILAYGFLYKALFVETVQLPYQKLKASELQLSTTLNALPDLLFELDEQGNYLEVHARETSKLLAPEHSLLGRNIRDVMTPEATDTCFASLQQAKAESISRGRRIALYLNGQQRYFELSVAIKANITPNRFLVLSRDVTDLVEQEQSLKQKQQQLDYFFSSNLDLFCICDQQGRLLQLNEAWQPLTGFSTVEMLGSSLLDFVDATDQTKLQQAIVQLQQNNDVLDFEIKWRLKEGGSCTLEWRIKFDGTLIYASARDISERKHQNATIQKLSAAVDQSPFPIIITDANACIEYVNLAFVENCGYSKAEVIGQNPRVLKSGYTPEQTYQQMWSKLKAGELWNGELINKHKNGSLFTESAYIYPIRNEQGEIVNYLAHKEDITARKQIEARLQQLSNFDQLTGLPNTSLLRQRFEERESAQLSDGQTMALMYLDLDNFKVINDALGQAIGDLVLREIAQRLRVPLNDQDTLSRQSGDHFTLLFPEMSQMQATAMASRLLATLAEPLLIEQHDLLINASIGIALYPNDATDFDALRLCAETAMYRVKQDGRNSFRFFAPDMQEHSARSLALDNALKHAISRHELRLVFQPQVCLQTGRIVGAETLLRWTSAQFGEISPAVFIPLAENNGLIGPISDWVLEHAARQLKQWQSVGITELLLAVNISALQFAQPGFVQHVIELVTKAGVKPQQIELELTEAVALKNPQAASLIMKELSAAGFSLSIDDFGTGYSSMSYLKGFAVDRLKIDQSFIRELQVSSNDQAIVKAIVQMAHSLGMRTIAEGVETQQQQDFLSAQYCDEIQGYFFSKPLSAEQFELFFNTHTKQVKPYPTSKAF